MKELTAKKILLLLFFFISGASVIETAANDYYCRPVYECECNPLYCGTFSAQFHAGVAPIIWKRRGEIDLLSCNANPENPIFQIASEFPKFKRLYKTPWIIGGKIGYAWTDNVEIYLEFNYLQAKQKDRLDGFTFVFPNVVPAQSLVIRFGKYHLFDGYLGVRYYWDRWCEWISPFIGVKVGFTAHRNINALLSINGNPVVISPAAQDVCIVTTPRVDNSFFRKNTVIAGGFNAGLDICFCGGWSFVITGEFVVSCAPRLRGPSVFSTITPAPLLATNIIFDGLGTELRFPITFGIKRVF